MQYNYIFLFIFCFSIGHTQVPSGYYDTATGAGYTLKTQLYNIINNHNGQGYNAIDGFFADYDLDVYYEDDNSILDIYSENSSGIDPYNFTPILDECGQYSGEGDCYNKEHIIPQSIFNENEPMRGDAHQLFPTDGRVNSFRGNSPMGRVDINNLASQSGISNPTQNGSKLGDNLNSGYSAGYTGTVFEPIDEFKGDIARAHFYFATRYENQITNWSAYDMFDGSSDKVFETSFLNILLEWHTIDPVSQKEIDRNNAIYYNHQGNRNPYVDYPEYVSAIWSPQQDNENPSAPTNLVATNPTDNSVTLSWTAATDNISVNLYEIFLEGVLNMTSNTTSATITGLASSTTHCFTVVAKDAAGNSSTPSNEACETTLAVGNGNTDLFLSEYMEGSSSNKAIEIANFTGEIVNLSEYSLKLSSNSNTTWTVSYSFPTNTSVANDDVYVIANGGTVVCNSVFDNLNNSINNFNGNDAIGLFKNDVLIDIIGVVGDDSNFAKDVTLVRNADISSGTTTYNSSEWTSFPQNTCDNLGSHTQTLSSINTKHNNIKIHPNPANGNILFVEVQRTTEVEVFNLTGHCILKTAVTEHLPTIDISILGGGLYILQLQNTKGKSTRKLVRQ